MCEDRYLLQGVCVFVCNCVPVSLVKQVDPSCMGSRQHVRHTDDCGQAYHAYCAVCGSSSDTLWVEGDLLTAFTRIPEH